MDNQARKKGAQVFAAAFAQSLSEVLTESSGMMEQLGVVDDLASLSGDGVPIQFRIQVEGALSGECFIEFYESQIVALLANAIGEPGDSLTDEHKKSFTKFVLAAVKKLGTST